MRRIAVCICALLAIPGLLRAADLPDNGKKDAPVKHVMPKEAEKLVSEHKVTVIDIRTPAEFEDGHIAGATNINYLNATFAEKVNSLPKTNSYLIHCASGNRSMKSLTVFNRQRFDSIYHLDGGFEAWKAAGLPVEK
jgi:rhodanese-related sulfurtransferase